MKKEIMIEGMSCNHCKMRVEKTLLGLEGITKAEVNLEEKKAVIELTADIENQVIIDAIDDAGYDVKDIVGQ